MAIQRLTGTIGLAGYKACNGCSSAACSTQNHRRRLGPRPSLKLAGQFLGEISTGGGKTVIVTEFAASVVNCW